MTPDRLLAHFDRLADAPDAIPRLRRFILDLAVRGKLVPQDPTDEPASALVAANQAKQERLTGKSGMKRTKRSTPDSHSADALMMPRGWILASLHELTLKITDGAHKTPNYVRQGVPFVSVKDFSAGRLDLSNTRFISQEEHTALYRRCDPRLGDILIGRIGTLGRAVLVDTDVEFSLFVSVGLIRFSDRVLIPKFFKLLLNSPVAEDEFNRIKVGGGTHTNKLNLGDLHTVALPLPPLAEQRRIVARVDELMALCDQLEAAQAERERQRDRLTAAALHRLNQPAEADDADSFAGHAGFVLSNLPRLATRPEHVKGLRETILNLAVRGKLVPQDPSDEPADAIIRGIVSDHATFGSSRAKSVPSATFPQGFLDLFEIPGSWKWTPTEFLTKPGRSKRYGILKPGPDTQDGVPYVRILEMKSGAIDVPSLRRCAPSHEAKFQQARLLEGDLIVSKDGTIGKVAIVPKSLEGGNITQHHLRVSPSHRILGTYLAVAIKSPFCQTWMTGEVRGLALQRINVGDFRQMPIPLPPLAEQRWIVARVDELMALCDQLEAQLTMARDQKRRLLEAVLHEALVSAEAEPEREASFA